MTVKDIIKLACDFIELPEICDKLEANQSLTTAETKIVNKLVKMFNLIQNEVATDYLALTNSEKVYVQDNKVRFTSLSKTPTNILSVKNITGVSVPFKVFPGYITVNESEATVTYAYTPNVVVLTSTITEALLPERVYAYGVAREYFLSQAQFDEADIWENRFKDSLQILLKKKGQIVMPARRFL